MAVCAITGPNFDNPGAIAVRHILRAEANVLRADDIGWGALNYAIAAGAPSHTIDDLFDHGGLPSTVALTGDLAADASISTLL